MQRRVRKQALTQKELRVLILRARGGEEREIAALVGISQSGVHRYLTRGVRALLDITHPTKERP